MEVLINNIEEKLDNTRYSFLDVVKGIGIIFVIFGHIIPEGLWIRSIIYSFHMPLFFLISGFFPAKRDEKFFGGGYLKKQFKNLYVPYLVVVIFDFVIKVIFLISQKTFEINSIVSLILSLTGFRISVYNAPVWFLFSLFVIKCVAYFVQKNKVIEIGTILLSVTFVVLCQKSIINKDIIYHCLYFESISGLFYFLLGKYIFALFKKMSEYKNVGLLCIAVTALLLFLIPLSKLNGKINVANYVFGKSFALFLINSLIGILFAIILSILIDRTTVTKKSMLFIGKNSMVFMLVHYYFTNYIWVSLFMNLGMEHSMNNAILWIIELIVTTLIIVPIVLLINKKYKRG